MVKLGLTGGIGSGKSYIAGLLAARGVLVYDTDREAKRLMTESPSIRQRLTALLGEEAYAPDDTLNRKLVASYLFASSEHADVINGIVHPVVREDFLKWSEEQTAPCVVMECAILFESGFDALVDRVVLVRAPERVCIERAMLRDGATEEQIKARMALQMSDEERSVRSHYIIDNDGRPDMDAAVDRILAQIPEIGFPEDFLRY